jgi:regulator of protease activity HflC (stomatin/prohibitin superfamily)
VQGDVLTMAMIVIAGVVLATLLLAVRRAQEARLSRPQLPAADQPPAGLGRLVPIGVQVDDEYHRGVDALERWMSLHHRAGPEGT